jgi:hypothetical protein
MRPSGVWASTCLRKSLVSKPARARLGLDRARIDGVDADVARAQLLGQRRVTASTAALVAL